MRFVRFFIVCVTCYQPLGLHKVVNVKPGIFNCIQMVRMQSFRQLQTASTTRFAYRDCMLMARTTVLAFV